MKNLQRQIDTRIKASVSSRELSGEALNARIADLRKALKGWLPAGGVESVYDYERFEAYHILPFSGGYREQPAWLLDDFKMLGLWFELARLLGRLTDASTVRNTMRDVVTGNKRNA